ncbi:hypothetical protein [Mucilaginibacter antarcticus]|uniref:Uncharacterized protein n=1 Tax=Mucilaginibacter antarcticus TaxID=1855725 RepID=A0ABW5XQP9_9SPHI
MSCEFFEIPPGGQETFCETKRHLAVAKATEILIINLGLFPLNKQLGATLSLSFPWQLIVGLGGKLCSLFPPGIALDQLRFPSRQKIKY